jgi:hypothetical protein
MVVNSTSSRPNHTFNGSVNPALLGLKTPRRRKRLSTAAVYGFINRCGAEIRICERSKAYLAGIVLTGVAIEEILAAWIRAFDILKFAKHKKKLTDHWSLKELNDLAYAQGLFDLNAFQAAERIRKFRNLVHPNWFAGRNPARFTKQVLDAWLRDYDAVIDSIQRYI